MNMKKKILNSPWIGFLSFIIVWQVVHLLLNSHTIPSPMDTLIYAYKIPKKLLLHSLSSIGRVGISILVSLILGIPIGIYLGVNKNANRFFSPLLYFIYPIPKVAFLPVFMLLYGLGNKSKIILIIWIIIFQIILSVRDGVLQVLPLYYKVMNGFGATKLENFRYLLLPAILPHIFSGLRASIGISLATLFFAENYATNYGIGYFILSAWTKMNYVEMFSGILTIGIIGVILFWIIDCLEIYFTPWIKREKQKD
jgi:ABC-type nitrate/sulfonate/bicarbonate transport system permease component